MRKWTLGKRSETGGVAVKDGADVVDGKVQTAASDETFSS
jgi:hypothetical protein